MNVEISCGKCAHRFASRGGSGENVNFCPSCGAPVESAASAAPIVISPADVEQVEAKPQVASSPEPFVGRPQAASSAMWVIVPAVAAVMATFGFLMCGGVFFLIAMGGSSDAVVEPEPYTAYSVPIDTYSSDPYDSTSYESASYPQPIASDYSSTPVSETPYVPASYESDPYASTPVEIAPSYVDPIYSEPTYVEPPYVDPAETAASDTPYWSFTDPESELLAAIQRDEEELVGMDAAILAARAGEIVGESEVQDGETVADQLFGLVFAVGSDAVEQGLLTERAAVQARLDANRAELSRLRGY